MKSDRSGTVQYAALPWRQGQAGLEILLLTSRETRRWVIPKGWPMIGVTPQDCAAEEAFEEGGVRGRVSGSIGAFAYDKILKDGSARALNVDVFPLHVTEELKSWPEADERTRQWFTLLEAADAVDEPDLATLIRVFTAPA